MMGAAPATIYQSSDLNQRGRVVLDAAREGLVRVRDKDGASLVMTREERFDDLRRSQMAGMHLAHAAANFMVLERAVMDRPTSTPAVAELGEWVWLRHLPTEDVRTFVAELRDALYRAFREFSAEPLDEVLDAWRETAAVLRDPLSHETLLDRGTDEDYVIAPRPVSASADAADAA